jgi:hypothetical protein
MKDFVAKIHIFSCDFLMKQSLIWTELNQHRPLPSDLRICSCAHGKFLLKKALRSSFTLCQIVRGRELSYIEGEWHERKVFFFKVFILIRVYNYIVVLVWEKKIIKEKIFRCVHMQLRRCQISVDAKCQTISEVRTCVRIRSPNSL